MNAAGFWNVDGLDASKEMLQIGKARGIYMNTIVSYIGKEHPIPIEDGNPSSFPFSQPAF